MQPHTFKELKKAAKQECPKGKPLKIAILGDSATQFLTMAIKGEAFLRGYNADIFEADYNQVEMLVMNTDSDLYQYKADYTIIFQSTHKLLEHYGAMPANNRINLAEERVDFIRNACQLLSGRIIYYNYPEIDDTVFGNYASKVESSFTYQLTKLNYELNNLSRELPNLFICNLAGLTSKIGRDNTFDAFVYTTTEVVLNIDASAIVASNTMDIVDSIEGKFKKCLILDLDNTLWGGVVGDDGWENIQIGHGLGVGTAFTELQQWIKKLRQRGIILCVCSKNDEEKAKEPFEKNPDMVLKLDDISVFIANWENKVDNIRTIQSILNIGFDSMVFLDDNPFERNMVKESIPAITVPELPQDPSNYLEFLYSLNLFETANFSANDKDRTKQYQIEAKRVSAKKSFCNEADFLKSLNMVSVVKGFDKYNTPRVAQLSQRSNQFNLRTVRYTDAEIEAIGNSSDYASFSFTLSDKFGDNGLISVVIMKKMDVATLFIDTWFMSCRVLKRGMENFIINTIVDYAKANGYKSIIGEYIPTLKNAIVKDVYPTMGFKTIDNEINTYILEVNSYTNKETYIKQYNDGIM